MPTFPADHHRFDDITISVGLEVDRGIRCVHLRVTWDLGGTALFALGLDGAERTFRLLVPSSRVRLTSDSEFSLHAVPLEQRWSGLEPLYRRLGLAVTGPNREIVLNRLAPEPDADPDPSRRVRRRTE
jgi:hypothetical protein